MKAKIIIGANYGDEGKGTVCATCTRNFDGKTLNVLTNGGPQRGHSYQKDNGGYVTFKHFGSGTLFNADNYFYKTFIVNPMAFVIEYNNLYLDESTKVYCSDKCRFTTPFDSLANLIMEVRRKENKHGSCGMGIWNTIQRYSKQVANISFCDFMKLTYIDKFNCLAIVRKYYTDILGELESEYKSIWFNDNMIAHFIEDCIIMKHRIVFISDTEAKTKFSSYEQIIFENGQGLLLTDTGKDIAGTTPTNTTSLYAVQAINEIFTTVDSVEYRYITRPYITKHGNGDFENECEKSVVSTDIKQEETNAYNDNQGEFRYGILNIPNLKDRIISDYNNTSNLVKNSSLILDVTHCDEVDRTKEFNDVFKNIKINEYFSPKILKC